MYWRITHDFLKWLWPATFGAAIAAVTIALAASELWPEAKVWTATVATKLWEMIHSPAILFFAAVIFCIWLIAFILSGCKVAAIETVAVDRDLSTHAVDPVCGNRLETQKLRRKAIADCRNMVAEWGGNHSHSDQRDAIERNPSFQMMRRHLEPRFLEFLARRAGAFIDSNEPHRPMLMAALASQLDRLETEWDLS